ncbi:MAG: hypothetical protein U0746_00105 [Gemmataceae bacterium]
MTLSPLSASVALDAYFLEARSKLLDLAAILDRIDRGCASGEAISDPKLNKLRQAFELLASREPTRAEKLQVLFSLDYDPAWKRPTPR